MKPGQVRAGDPRGAERTNDWRVVFFPWQNEPAYSDAVPRPVGEETARYFAGLPASAGEFSPGQMSWYQRKRAELGMFVLREFPTVMEECFQAPIEGAIYPAAIDRLRVEGAIKPWIVDNSALTRLGSRLAHQHGGLVFPDRGQRNPRD